MSFLLKTLVSVNIRRSFGRQFHSTGPEKQKARSAILYAVWVSSSRNLADDTWEERIVTRVGRIVILGGQLRADPKEARPSVVTSFWDLLHTRSHASLCEIQQPKFAQ